MIRRFTIYGERCSGTNYLENLILKNFDVELTWDYGWKHFFGHHPEQLKDSDDVLFICIVRGIVPWLNSLYKDRHHLQLHVPPSAPDAVKIHEFLNKPVVSFQNQKEIMEDRNIYTKQHYANIFELRHIKLKYMIKDLPTQVKHCILIRHEDLLRNFSQTMTRIKDMGLTVKPAIPFPLNETMYKKNPAITYNAHAAKQQRIKHAHVVNHPSFRPLFENQLGYPYPLRR